MVICKECESEFKIVSPQHLKYKHNMSVNEYILKYPI
jgi:predicted transcriptional regulator